MSDLNPGNSFADAWFLVDGNGQPANADATPTVVQYVDAVSQGPCVVTSTGTGLYLSTAVVPNAVGKDLVRRFAATLAGVPVVGTHTYRVVTADMTFDEIKNGIAAATNVAIKGDVTPGGLPARLDAATATGTAAGVKADAAKASADAATTAATGAGTKADAAKTAADAGKASADAAKASADTAKANAATAATNAADAATKAQAATVQAAVAAANAAAASNNALNAVGNASAATVAANTAGDKAEAARLAALSALAAVQALANGGGENGNGDQVVTQDSPGCGGKVKNADGTFADGVVIQAIPAVLWPGGPLPSRPPTTYTNATGDWVRPLNLEAGGWVLIAYNPATGLDDVRPIVVGGQ